MMKGCLVGVGVGMFCASTLLGVAGVLQDWVHVVQAVIGVSILSFVLVVVGAVFHLLDVCREVDQ